MSPVVTWTVQTPRHARRARRVNIARLVASHSAVAGVVSLLVELVAL